MHKYNTNLVEAQRNAKAFLEQTLENIAGTEAASAFLLASPQWHVPMEKLVGYWLDPSASGDDAVNEPDPRLESYTVRQALTAMLRYTFHMPLSDVIETRALGQKDLGTITEHSEEAKKLFEFAWALDDLANRREPDLSRLAEGLGLLKQMRQKFYSDYQETKNNANNSALLELEHYRSRAEQIVEDCREGKPIPTYIPSSLKSKIMASNFHENERGSARLFELIKCNERLTPAEYKTAQESFLVSAEISHAIGNVLDPIIQQLQRICIDAGAVPVRVRRGNDGPPSR